MPRLNGLIPKYRLHRRSNQAIVTLNCRDYYLGRYGTDASKLEYDRLVAEWLAHSRNLTPPTDAQADGDGPYVSVNQVIHAFWQHAQIHYRKADGTPAAELGNFRQALRHLRRLFGQTNASKFGPRSLKAVRQQMIGLGWCRTNINRQVSRIKSVFRWAVENEMVPADIHHALSAIRGLQKGRTTAREAEPVRPVPEERIEAINPPFNVSDWGGQRLREDARWKYGTPPVGNANYAWIQDFIYHLGPNGVAGFVMANGSMSSNQSGEGEIRKAIVEADLVDCMIALPGQLFYTTQIPVCLWFVTRNKANGKFRDRRRQTLFIDARKMGVLIDRIHRELTDEEIARIARTYHAWRGEKGAGKYEDIPGFCKSATTDEIASHGHVLTPGRYVGAEEAEDDGEPFDQKMKRLTKTLDGQFAESAKLEKQIRENLGGFRIGAGT
jgi:hypothetical protein